MSEPFIKKVVSWVYKHFENGSGAMILMTSIIGMALSTAAQTGAILFNKKYTDSQKAFMVPQELTEGLINICSMLVITRPLQKLSGKLVKTGKIATKEVLNYMKRNNLLGKRGQRDFDFGKKVSETIENIRKTDIFISSADKEKTEMLSEHKGILDKYDIYSDSISAIATTAGAVFSTALIAPLIRNSVASKYQQINLDRITAYNMVKNNKSGSDLRI